MYPYDEVDPNMEEPLEPGLVLKNAAAKRKSAGNALSSNVVGAPASVLPNAIKSMRTRAGDLYKQGSDLYNSDPDTSQMQEFARQRGQQGESSMLTALAAQFAGEGFAPLQEQMLKKSAASSEPMKFGAGMLTPQGNYIKDPFAAQDKKAEFLLQQAKMYEQLATTAETKQEQQAYRDKQDSINNEIRGYMAQTGRMNAQSASLNATGGGGLGAGAAQQIGSGPRNEAIFRQKNGQLFTYDLNGEPIAYQGEVLPRATSAQPSEDERKAAGWFFQADNARRNMEAVIKKSPQSAYPTVGERVAGFIPGVGEDFANSLRPEERQKFVQAGSSMSEALLRAATGAGMNEYEAKQKVRELVPQLGDTPGVVAQKTASYDVYMKALQARAGRALPQNSPGGAPAANSDPLGMRR